ncbi:hypothetical protein [Rhizobacter sp. P5_C2]
MTDESTTGSGGYSIAGYDYQVDVSVWLALDLVLASHLAREVTIEPASEEDLEAELAPCEPGRLTSTTCLEGYRLIVQAKRRTGDAWTVLGVKALLEHGAARPSAKQRLVDPHARYLLVTNAALNGGARDLGVRHPGSWPIPGKMPASIAAILPSGASGRVAVIANQDDERLATDIKLLLTESFRVPKARLAQCIERLRQESRVRIRGAGGGRWTRDELERVIREHDGYIASSPELDRYVYPTNWQELRTRMRERSAALVVGQSGSGKTMATRKLFEELSAEVPGLARVSITRGPKQMQEDRTLGPVLYDIEDPWGRYDFDPASRPWNDQLAQLFAQARHDCMVIATSRLDVAQAAGAMETVKPWVVAIEAEHYGPRERQRLYRGWIDALPRDLRTVAKQSEKAVLAELATPLEIQKYFDALPTIDGDIKKSSSALVGEAIRRAHQDSIERTVIDQIEGRGDVRSAAVVWALLKATDKLSMPLLLQIEGPLADLDAQLDRGVRPLVQFFVAARNLRQVEDLVTYYHPRVEAGIEKALLRHPLVVRRTFERLIEVLLVGNGLGGAWAAAIAARVLHATDRTAELKPSVSAQAQSRIDAWLATELQRGGKTLEENMGLAASAGSSSCNLAEVARFLLHRPDTSFPGFSFWGAPDHDEIWRARMRADPAVKSLIETFIRDVLPESRDTFHEEFVTEVARLAGDLTPAFRQAAARSVFYGVTNNGRVIAAGALADVSGFEAIVDEAVQVLTPSAEELKRAAEVRLDLDNDVYSEGYAEHIATDDSGYTAREFLEAYVDHLRGDANWRGIAEHRHVVSLLPYWFRSLSRDIKPDPDEVAAAFAMGLGHDEEEYLWGAATAVGSSSFEDRLLRRVLDGHRSSSARQAALTCLALHDPAAVGDAVRTLAQRSRDGRIIEIAEELGEMRVREARRELLPLPNVPSQSWREGTAIRDALELAYQGLEPKVQEVCDLIRALDSETAISLSLPTSQWLAAARNPSEVVRWLRVRIDKQTAMFLPEDVRWILAASEEVGHCVGAIEAAIRHGMTEEIEAGLSHRFAYVVALSLRHLAATQSPRLSPPLLALAASRGSPVRRALAEVLQEKPHDAHVPTLLKLAVDKWSPDSSYRDQDDYYPIARLAITAIAKLGSVDAATADALYGIAMGTRDPRVRFSIFEQLVRLADAGYQERLFDLAVAPGSATVRRAAANALGAQCQHVVPEVVAKVTPDLIKTRLHGVATWLLLLASLSGGIEQLLSIAEELAMHPQRRVLLLLTISVLSQRDAVLAQRVAGMLPANHAGVLWAMAGGQGDMGESTLEDLGDTVSVDLVLKFMRPEWR